MYTRVINKLKEQKLIYVDYKNIEQIKAKIDEVLLQRGSLIEK